MLVTKDRTATSGLAVQADPEFPVNRGQMCIKGFTSSALIAHPARLTSPRVRDASGKLATASWDAALDYVAERFAQVRERYGPSALSAFGSGALTNEKAYLLGKFARLALRTPNIDYNGRYCMASGAAGQNRVFGVDRGMPFPVSDIAETETLVLWGANSAETMPPMMQWVLAQKNNGGHLIVVDPRKTDTARNAALHLQLTPGSDLALANGLLHLAIEKKLINLEYIARRTEGFDDAKRNALNADPATTERLTGVSVRDQVRAIQLIAGAETAMLLTGRGVEQQSKGSDSVAALASLMLALGKVGKRASGYGTITGQANGQGGREHGQKADQLPGYRYIENPIDRGVAARVWGVPQSAIPGKGKSAYELFDAIGKKGGVRSMFVMGSNVAVASPNAGFVRKNLAALDLLVVCDAFDNDTSALAHAVLPTTQWAEESGTLTNLEGRVILRRRIQDPPTGVKSDFEILEALATRLGVGEMFRFPSVEAVFDELKEITRGAKADYSGMTYERLEANGGLFWPCPSEDHPGSPRLFSHTFPRPSGLASFSAVPHRPAAEMPDREYPLYFTTGRYKEHYNSGAQTRRVDKLVDARREPKVEVHPHLAERLGVEEGGLLLIESRRGAVTFRVTVSADIRVDTLFAPFHWGGASAANVLTMPALDPTSRMPEFKVCAVRARNPDA